MNSFIPAKTNAECGEQSWIEAAERVTIALNKVGFVCLFVVIQMVEGQSAFVGCPFSFCGYNVSIHHHTVGQMVDCSLSSGID